MALQHLRSSTANKRPTPAAMSDGQLAMNTNLVSPGLFLKDSNGDLVKVGPVHVGTTAPNATPAAGGQAGNSVGEQWLDTSSSRYVFKIWDGTAWRTEDDEFVNISGDTMTGALGIIAGTVAAPGVFFSGDTNTGIYSPGADTIAFSEGGVEAMRIDSSGRLLVGTSSVYSTGVADPKLQVVGTGPTDSAISVSRFRNDGGAANIALFKGRGSAGNFTVINSGDSIGQIQFFGADGTKAVAAAQILCQSDGTPGADDMPGRLVFSTTADGAATPTERMRIDSSGNINIGTAIAVSPSSSSASGLGLTITENGGIAAKTTQSVGSVFFEQNILSYTSGTITYQRFRVGGTIIGSISSTNGTSTAYNTSSDYRLKENVTAVTDGITRLQQLKPSRFNFKADPNTVVDGFIAHEAQEVVPECVTGEKDAVDDDGNPVYQGIDQSKLVPLLTAALQEAIGEIESLKARLTAAGI